jgi:hypothetical protein
MRALLLLAAFLGAAALLAGCGGGGGGGESTTGTTTRAFDPTADVTYSRAYTDCGSVNLVDLAHRYKVKPQRDKVALAVATYWTKQAHGGDTALEAAKEGCYDGFKAAGH